MTIHPWIVAFVAFVAITRRVAGAAALLVCCGASLGVASSFPSAPADDGATSSLRDILLELIAEDGTALEAKLTLPPAAASAVPVVFWLHGAGVGSYDTPYRFVDDDGNAQRGRYMDYHARELADRGIAFFRMSKRGCRTDPKTGDLRLDQAVFRGATMQILLNDYATALAALRARDEIDASRIVLLGASEGTRLAPQLALREPEGIRGIVMIGYAQDSAERIVTWQLTHGPWRGIQHAIPAARRGSLSREAYDAALAADPTLANRIAFEPLDADGDGTLTPDDIAVAMQPLRDALLTAYAQRNDALLWARLGNVTSAYLADWWDAEPNHATLLELDMPLAIYHGALDNTTRVEGVHEAVAAFDQAGRTNLVALIDPSGDHALNLDWRSARGAGPPGYIAAFDTIARWLTTEADEGQR